MKRILSLSLVLLILLSACAPAGQEETPKGRPVAHWVETSFGVEGAAEEKEESTDLADIPLAEVVGVRPVAYEPDWSVETSSADFLRELTNEKYGGRIFGSSGSKEAANWIEEQFAAMGLQPFGSNEEYQKRFMSVSYEQMDGYAAIVHANGSETPLKLGVDWAFSASFEEVDLTLPLSSDEAECLAGNAFLDKTNFEGRPDDSLINITSSEDVYDGLIYANIEDTGSDIKVSPEVYEQLTQPGSKLHLRLPQAAEDTSYGLNVIGYLPGENQELAVVLFGNYEGYGRSGAHMQSAYRAASAATVMQTASWLSQAESLPCDVFFVAKGGKTDGRDGVENFFASQGSSYSQILFIQPENVGWADAEEPYCVTGEDEQAMFAAELAGGLGLPVKSLTNVGFSDENMTYVTIHQHDMFIDGSSAKVMSNTMADTFECIDTDELDDLSKQLASWIMERGGIKIFEYPTFW